MNIDKVSEFIGSDAYTPMTIEKIMKNVMYEIPSMEGVNTCHVTKDVVQKGMEPELSYGGQQREASA